MKNFIRFIIGLYVLFVHASVSQAYAHQYTVEHGMQWRNVQNKAKDTVVQVFAQSEQFNWFQPFKAAGHKKSFGTGFFIDKQGHIVSNFHVIEGAHEQGIKVQIPSFGKEQFSVAVVGVCPDRDLALLKLTPEALKSIKGKHGTIQYLELGDSDRVVRTQEILALGYPLGQEKLKSTQGIVSGREIVWGESYMQITAALNPGNSGGPSLNNEGKVVGINTARMPTAQNIGYIIPINDVKSVLSELKTTRLLRIPTLGCEFNYATRQMVKFLGNPKQGGLYISHVHKDTLCDRMGIQEGDMLYAINGHAIDLYGETNVPWSEDKVPLVALLNRLSIGQDVACTLYRNGKKIETQATYTTYNDLPIRKMYPGYEKIDYEILGGMVVMPLTINHIERCTKSKNRMVKDLLCYEKRDRQYEPKLIVTHIFPTSQAQEARCIKPGDIIDSVNGQRVGTLDDVRRVIKETVRQPMYTNSLVVKTEEKKSMVLAFNRVIADEERLAKRYAYKKSRLCMLTKQR